MPCIRFTGGEPLLHNDLFDLLEYATKYFNHIELSTNALLLNEYSIKRLKEMNIIVQFSIYSLKDKIHDKITNVKGSYKKLINNIKLLSKYGIKFEANYIFTKYNENDFEEVKKFIHNYGGIIENPDIIRPCDKKIDKIVSKKMENQLRKNKKYFAHFTTEQFYKNITGNGCWKGLVIISSDYKVIPCVMARKIVLGNLKKDSLTNIINNEKTKYLWSLNRKFYEGCMDCEFKYACYDCRAANLNVGMGLFTKSFDCLYNPKKGKWKK